ERGRLELDLLEPSCIAVAFEVGWIAGCWGRSVIGSSCSCPSGHPEGGRLPNSVVGHSKPHNSLLKHSGSKCDPYTLSISS
ncbi:hypothetical protein QC764_0021580, partial [Podospora pseudoanserina]